MARRSRRPREPWATQTGRPFTSREVAEAAAFFIHQAITQYAELMNMPRAWTANLVSYVEDNRVIIQNIWKKPGWKGGPVVNLGDIFENGSKDHDIVVKYAKRLHYYSWDIMTTAAARKAIGQQEHFAVKVHVRGIRGLQPMKRGWRVGKRRFRDWLYSKKTIYEWNQKFRPNINLYQRATDPDPGYYKSGRPKRTKKKDDEVHSWVVGWNRGYTGKLHRFLTMREGMEDESEAYGNWKNIHVYRKDHPISPFYWDTFKRGVRAANRIYPGGEW